VRVLNAPIEPFTAGLAWRSGQPVAEFRNAGADAPAGVGGLSFEIARSMRDVLLGAEVPVSLTQRAAGLLAGLRSDAIGRVHADRLVISRGDDDLR
jgi:hypothetical protein